MNSGVTQIACHCDEIGTKRRKYAKRQYMCMTGVCVTQLQVTAACFAHMRCCRPAADQLASASTDKLRDILLADDPHGRQQLANIDDDEDNELEEN